MDNVRVVVADMPCSVRAYTIYSDDFYTIVLNDNLSYMQRQKAYMHEIEHIKSDDFIKDSSVGIIEFYAHK